MKTPATSRPLWRRHWPLLASAVLALAAAAWLLTPPARRMDGAAEIWAAEAPFVPPAPATRVEPEPLPPLSPVAPAPEPELPAEDLLEALPEPAPAERARGDDTHDLPPGLPPEAVEAWPPPAVGDLMVDEDEPQW